MASLTPLSRPTHNLVNIDPNPRDSMSDGFNYPSFHLLNKQARVFLSEPQKVNPAYPYHLLAIANIKGWFAAVRTEGNGTSIIFSTLLDLRSSLKSAKENDENLLVPRRTVRLPADDVNMVAFGMHDTRLIVAFIGGQLLVYDTIHLFSAGTNDIAPLNMSNASPAPFVRILPNPGAETDLTHLVAVVRADGVVQVLDINTLEAKCGWAGEGDSAPVAISWAPKGKHLAIGLRVGDIITYALSNNTLPHKQIPPTVDGYLVSLDWVASPLVFKTTYCSKIPESSDATLHIVHADAKSSTGFYYNLMHPFPAADRNKMHALMLSFPKWDEDSGSTPENASGLAIIGDMSSVDLEVLAHKSAQWFQQSQENPLQLPLDKNMNDTIITSLEADLTDLEANVPIMYAYLNDGTLQGWTLDHPKPYVGMIKSDSAIAFNGPIIAQETPTFAAALSLPTPSTRSSTMTQPATSSLSQQPIESPFSKQGTFGQTSFDSGQAFGQSSSPVFKNVQKPTGVFGSAPSTNSGFGSFTSVNKAFGQHSLGLGVPPSTDQSSAPQPITREASMSDETSLGDLNLGDNQTTPRPKSGGGIFGSFTSPADSTTSTSAFGSFVKPAVGFGAFNDYHSQQESTRDAPKSVFSPSGSISSTLPGQSTFGQSGFGQPSFVQASFGKPASTSAGSGGFNSFDRGLTAFVTPSKPATTGGFSAFASSPATAFGATTTPTSEPPRTLPFAAPSGVFGEGTEQATFKPTAAATDSPPSSPEPMVIVRPSGSVDDDMSPPGSPVKREAKPMSTTPSHPPPVNTFSNLAAPIRPASGFGAFGGASVDSPFFKKTDSKPSTPNALFGKQPTSTTPTNLPPVNTAPKFGAPSMPSTKSAFTTTTSTTPTKSPPSGGFGAFSGTSAGFASFAGSKISFTELLKAKDEEAKDKPVSEKAEQLRGSAVPVTPKKEETPVTLKMAVFTPPLKPATTTPVSETPQKPAEKEVQMNKESSPEKKPISAEESFVEISKEEGEVTDEASEGGAKGEEDNDGYLSGSLGPSDSEGSIDGTEDEEELEEVPIEKIINKPRATSVDPSNIPLPASRSPSATPEVPSIQITPAWELSTPTGTPEKPPASISQKSVPSITPTSQPSNLGLGRPSTRPARSSPLASVPVTSDDQHGVSKEKARVEQSKPKTMSSPRLPTAELPAKTEAVEETKPPSPGLKVSTITSAAPPSPLAPRAMERATISSDLLKKMELTKFGANGDGVSQGSTPRRHASSEPVTPAPKAAPKQPFAITAETGVAPSTGFFGTQPLPTPFVPFLSEASRPASVPPFGKPPNKTAPAFTPSTFNIKEPSSDVPGIFGKLATPVETPPEEGMQKECAQLYNMMNQELDELRQLAQQASKKRQELAKSRGGSRTKADLGDGLKWGLADATQFGQLLVQFSPELLGLRELRAELKRQVRQVETRMLKAGTRKEEIARFTKAQSDKEFAKMLKTRTLGPEHLETQTQLRRSIRSLRDRIQKLEAHLQTAKKKLTEVNSGKPCFRAPTLDTINRTYRNIDLAIHYQTDAIGDVSERIAKLDLTTPHKGLRSYRDSRLPDESRRPFSVTPHIAITTAAALNAERAAQKLKRALFAARKEPLLNDKAAQVSPARITFRTPQKLTASPSDSQPNFGTPISRPAFQGETPSTPVTSWTFPEDDFSPSASPPTRRGAGRTKMHASNVPLKKSGGPSQPAPTTFDWGPLPAFNQQPAPGIELPVRLAPANNPPGFVPFSQFKK